MIIYFYFILYKMQMILRLIFLKYFYFNNINNLTTNYFLKYLIIKIIIK